jgi:hypothetical protein
MIFEVCGASAWDHLDPYIAITTKNVGVGGVQGLYNPHNAGEGERSDVIYVIIEFLSIISKHQVITIIIVNRWARVRGEW